MARQAPHPILVCLTARSAGNETSAHGCDPKPQDVLQVGNTSVSKIPTQVRDSRLAFPEASLYTPPHITAAGHCQGCLRFPQSVQEHVRIMTPRPIPSRDSKARKEAPPGCEPASDARCRDESNDRRAANTRLIAKHFRSAKRAGAGQGSLEVAAGPSIGPVVQDFAN